MTGSSLSTSPKANSRKHQQSHPQQHPPPQTVADYLRARDQRNTEDYKIALEKLQQSSLDDDMLSSFKRECFFFFNLIRSHKRYAILADEGAVNTW